MIKISEQLEEVINKIFPKLEFNLKLAQMNPDVINFMYKSFIFSLIFSINLSVIFLFILIRYGNHIFVVPFFFLSMATFLVLSVSLPKINIAKIRSDIESDIFIPSRMLLTLIESGNSLITALVGVSYSNAKSSKYFGKIASEIFLGKNIEQAIDDAIMYTPSDSFRRVLEPIKKSLKTGTDIKSNLLATLKDLSKEKIIEIEEYEKKLSPLSMFYMIFGAVVPIVGVVIFVLVMSVIGLRVEFFPFLFMLLIGMLFIQFLFIMVFQKIRPLVKL